jgi:predicted phosphodiesterase
VIYGVLSDIHGNQHALTAVLDALDRTSVDKLLCLGDLVGYNGDSDACVRTIRDRGVDAIAGNHDLISLGRLGLDRCAPKPAFALRRTREALADDTRAFLADLPATRTYEGRVALIHGGVDDVQEYLETPARIAANAARLLARLPDARVCFFGHTHEPTVTEIRDGRPTARPPAELVELDRGAAITFVNPGSVDAARRPVKLAQYAIFDSERWTISFRRVEYDHEAAERVARAGGYRMSPARRALRGAARWLRPRVGA